MPTPIWVMGSLREACTPPSDEGWGGENPKAPLRPNSLNGGRYFPLPPQSYKRKSAKDPLFDFSVELR